MTNNYVMGGHVEGTEVDLSKDFGSCCDELRDAMQEVPNPFFRVEDNGILYLTIGYMETAEGSGFFDQAVIYCPFCGSRLQDPEAIAADEDA